MTADGLLPVLTAKVRGAVHPTAGACVCGTGDSVLADRPDGTVVRHAGTVAKAHAADTELTALAARMAVAAHPAFDGILLPPLRPGAVELHGRPVTFWPYGTPVDRDDPDAAPWEEAARLLARLHRTPDSVLPSGLPPMRGPAKAARAIARLRAAGPHPAAAPVLRAWAVLPAWARDEAPMPMPDVRVRTLCHGDLHLGQLVRAAGGDWLLIDIDDLGLGDPAWDLARPAAWFACGLLPPDEWDRFLTAYRKAGGPAVPADSDPWPALDVPARALTAQTAALAIAKSVAAQRPLDEVETSVIDACDRMAVHPPGLAGGYAT
ncbi:aminoglycoside phosphotransferase (APT) family kinase protein [Streptomyces aurantiacus]|uniref:aminoglycoside phosphotransferase family protein n=1 Tax=Streptomyces aurantiacus TaxID=47760 RepID=UPI0027911CE4|nr:aminoglycoside phosphotransferase family protein [Streptomyces aurantiacus]MDQ0778537.1 aminoglycoside phosphotransferase (APT) family kinase protein [Streptomyces aurantiacus]